MKKSLYLVMAGIFLIAITFACAPQEKMPRVIAMKDFFRNPEKAAFRLSPDGQYLALLKPWQTRLNVHVQKIGEDEERRITSATERDIAGYFWASNTRIAYVQDKGGDENFRLYAVNIDGSEEKDVTPFEKVRVQLISPNYALAHQRLGQTYLQKKLFEDGIQELQAPIESAFFTLTLD
jgi:hypothetical protein